MAGALSPFLAPLGAARCRPRLVILACNAAPSDARLDAEVDPAEASSNGGGEGVAPPRLAMPGRAQRRRRRSAKKGRSAAAMRASLVGKGDQTSKTANSLVVEEESESAGPQDTSIGDGQSSPTNGNGTLAEEFEPLEFRLRRDAEGSTTPFQPLPFPRHERPAEDTDTDARTKGYVPLENDPNDMCVLPKPIFVLSDCTGESAANTVRAALGQFENCFKTSVPANLMVFRFLRDENRIVDIVQKAAKEEALIVFTLVDHSAVKILRTACAALGVSYVDLWSNLLDNMEKHLDTVRSGLPLGSPQRTQKLSEDYFSMIEAVEFTRHMDDGAHPHRWHEADLLLLGVSRSGKTPLSIYLGQRGYKVANLPLVRGIPVPKQLYEIDQSKIFGLILDAKDLHTIRQTRLNSLGVGSTSSSGGYAGMKSVQEELDYAWSMYKTNDWPVLDVTHSGVEETAARILKILTDRSGHTHPLWKPPVD
ncbi:unnamed protein product [Ostreobium quekettii]|uniref:Uncharacterized protein n=1 Tax=Ostreobium quekettii TaxID=121088 RepID=A0A8S1IUQ8_9CHLO|nr:unnamed protein product [Ostreobium quekettii]|eukprot:evm.model.scf_185.4 EVM.evm.TU.scf_185.4   scf_185:36808-44474(-)